MTAHGAQRAPSIRKRLIAGAFALGAGYAYAGLLVTGLNVNYVSTIAPPPLQLAYKSAHTARAELEQTERPLMAALEHLPINFDSAVLMPPKEPPALQIAPEALRAPDATDARADVAKVEAEEGRLYHEKPGGNILVVGVLVDSTGEILNAKILVGSAYPMEDLSRILLLPGTRDPNFAEHVPAGQTQWVELRYRYERDPIELP